MHAKTNIMVSLENKFMRNNTVVKACRSYHVRRREREIFIKCHYCRQTYKVWWCCDLGRSNGFLGFLVLFLWGGRGVKRGCLLCKGFKLGY